MASPQPKLGYSVDEYLALERAALERHEFVDGSVFAMAGESLHHGDILMNLSIYLGEQLQDSPCRPLAGKTKIRSGPHRMSGRSSAGMFSYPDFVIICGTPEYHDAVGDVILNPTAIFEVLSPSTESFDRGEKAKRYQLWNPTLTDYLLVSQDQPQIEQYTRKPDGTWNFRRAVGLDASIELESANCRLQLSDAYRRVEFPNPSEPDA